MQLMCINIYSNIILCFDRFKNKRIWLNINAFCWKKFSKVFQNYGTRKQLHFIIIEKRFFSILVSGILYFYLPDVYNKLVVTFNKLEMWQLSIEIPYIYTFSTIRKCVF